MLTTTDGNRVPEIYFNDDIIEGNIANFEAVFRGLQSCSDRDIEGVTRSIRIFLSRQQIVIFMMQE